MPDHVGTTTGPSLTGTLIGAPRDGTSVGPGGRLGKHEFLKLLTVQLRYQDPLNPMDAKDMASDLAQFSGLEQLLNINDTLAAAQASQQEQFDALRLAMQQSSALGTIGKTVVADSDKVVLSKDGNGGVDGTVMADVTTSGMAKLVLLDRSGKEVGSRSLGYVSTGRQTFAVSSAAKGAGEGVYRVRIDVTDGSGKDVPQRVFTVGTIDGITYGEDGLVRLLMGPLTIDLNAIVQILADRTSTSTQGHSS
jgi:flagellar basal-body rod modification protein FlgD